jgi:hypothetical protein
MPRYTTKLTRLAVVGLSACALLPATAAAMPINDGQAPAQHIVGQAITAGGGDVVSGGGYQLPTLAGTGVNAPPDFPTNTTSLPRPGASNSDGGFDTGALVALGVGILVALGAWFLVVATKRRTRERQAV